jgi:hypothetical protein
MLGLCHVTIASLPVERSLIPLPSLFTSRDRDVASGSIPPFSLLTVLTRSHKTQLLFSPMIYLTGIKLLFTDIKQPDFLLRHHCQGQNCSRESPAT